jgi:hypothetical protein
MFVGGVANSVINMPPREFDVTLGQYHKAYELKKYQFDEFTYGITSVQNFSNFRPSILLL